MPSGGALAPWRWAARALGRMVRVRRDQGGETLAGRWSDWLHGAWLTLRYVDEWDVFPAIHPVRGARIHITKRPGARFRVKGRMVLQGYLYSPLPSVLYLDKGAQFDVTGHMALGDNNRIKVAAGAKLAMGGWVGSSRFMVNSSAIIAAEKDLRIGPGCIIGHYCLVTDSDWHPIGGGEKVIPTVLEQEVWLFDGAKVLKGVTLGAGSAVLSNSIVIPGTYPPRSLLTGMPAVVKVTGIAKSNV